MVTAKAPRETAVYGGRLSLDDRVLLHDSREMRGPMRASIRAHVDHRGGYVENIARGMGGCTYKILCDCGALLEAVPAALELVRGNWAPGGRKSVVRPLERVLLKACRVCGGDVYKTSDIWGVDTHCLQCGR